MIDPEKINIIKKQIGKQIDNISCDIKTLSKLIEEIDNEASEYSRECMKQNPYIVKRVIKHIANGLCRSEAVLLVADELNISTSRVNVLFNQQKAYMTALHLFSKKYLCEKMKAAGYPAKDIAAVLNISENHVYKLLKSVPNEWILNNF